ncbi:hypothetical protein [Elstera litoralis]|nr:hypothetical protein [Elstera litoralis]
MVKTLALASVLTDQGGVQSAELRLRRCAGGQCHQRPSQTRARDKR